MPFLTVIGARWGVGGKKLTSRARVSIRLPLITRRRLSPCGYSRKVGGKNAHHRISNEQPSRKRGPGQRGSRTAGKAAATH